MRKIEVRIFRDFTVYWHKCKVTPIFVCWLIFKLLLSSADFFKTIFQEHIRGVKRFGSRLGLSVLIWIQTVCKCYQQSAKDAASSGKVTCKMPKFLIYAYIYYSANHVYCLRSGPGHLLN